MHVGQLRKVSILTSILLIVHTIAKSYIYVSTKMMIRIKLAAAKLKMVRKEESDTSVPLEPPRTEASEALTTQQKYCQTTKSRKQETERRKKMHEPKLVLHLEMRQHQNTMVNVALPRFRWPKKRNEQG